MNKTSRFLVSKKIQISNINQLPLWTISLVLSMALSACGGGGKTSSIEDGTQIIDFGQAIKGTCKKSMDNVFNESFYYEEELASAIRSGDAPCARKAIETGNLDVNQPIKGLFDKEPVLPIWSAMSDSSFFFSPDGQEYAVLKVLVDKGASLDLINKEGETPLLAALKHEKPKKYPLVSQYLIQTKKIDLDKKDRNGKSALYYTMDIKNEAILNDLIKYKADVNIQSGSSGAFPISYSVMVNQWEKGALILLQADSNFTSLSPAGKTVLHEAIEKDFTELSAALINKMTIETLDIQEIQQGKTALYEAVLRNQESTVLKLLDKGANATHSAINGEYPLTVAVNTIPNDTTVTKLIKLTITQLKDSNDPVGYESLSRAVAKGRMSVVSSLTPDYVEINRKSHKDGSTALFSAKTVPQARQLIEMGADPHLTNDKKQNAGVLALLSKNESLFLYFARENSVDVGWTGDRNTTLLHTATHNNMLDAMRFLVTKINPDTFTNGERHTPLFLAYSSEALRILLDNGADINFKNKWNNTVLMVRVLDVISANSHGLNMMPLVEILVDYNASVKDVYDQSGKSLISQVLSYRRFSSLDTRTEYLELTDLLLKQTEIDLNIQDAKRETVLFHLDTFGELIRVLEGSLKGKVDPSLRNENGLIAIEYHQQKLIIDQFESNRIANFIFDLQEKINNEVNETFKLMYEQQKAANEKKKETVDMLLETREKIIESLKLI